MCTKIYKKPKNLYFQNLYVHTCVHTHTHVVYIYIYIHAISYPLFLVCKLNKLYYCDEKNNEKMDIAAVIRKLRMIYTYKTKDFVFSYLFL